MTHTLPGADIRGYYEALGIELPEWAQHEATVRCFAEPGAHRRGDHHPSCSVNLEHGAWRCHGCGARGGAFDAATAVGHTERGAIDLMIRYGITSRRSGPGGEDRPSSRQSLTVAGSGITRRTAMPQLTVTAADISHWETALTAQTMLIGRLTRERGWLYSTMLELNLGYDCGRITIPVRDDRDRLVGLLR
ncbi:MAG: hypothetical protein ACP5H2_13075, partial [Solirubrobacteraceae bacterium]